MHDGYKIIRFAPSVLERGPNAEESDWAVSKTFNKHDSLAYGVDWSRRKKAGTEDSIIASCSFYDHTMYTWAG